MNQDPDVAIEGVDENNNSSSDETTIESSSETINRNIRRGVRLGVMLNYFIGKSYMGTCMSLSWISNATRLCGGGREPLPIPALLK